MKELLNDYFLLDENGTDIKTEAIAGITTFFTMSYIIFLNPAMLSLTGMSSEAVFMATIIASVIGTLIMGLYANVPLAQAPGVGLNAFFTYTVCFGLGFTWQQALGMVMICGIVGMIITATGIRVALMNALPDSIKSAIGGGIGLFLAYVGIKSSGLLQFSADAGTWVEINGNVIVDSTALPSLSNFSNPSTIVAIIGLFFTLILCAIDVKGGILIGILFTFILSMIFISLGVSAHYFLPDFPVGSTLNDVINSVNLDISSLLKNMSALSETAFQIDFSGLFSSFEQSIISISAIVGFVLADIFDTIGTLIGTCKKSGIFKDSELDKQINKTSNDFSNSKLTKSLVADLVATSVGAVCGTSNVTTYVESATGVAVGGRTGLASVFTAGMFILCIPLVSVINIIPSIATAPALIVVGIFLMSALEEINWNDFSTAAVAFVTITFMPFAYSINTGISVGFIVYTILEISKGNIKKINPLIFIFTGLFLLNYFFTAVKGL